MLIVKIGKVLQKFLFIYGKYIDNKKTYPDNLLWNCEGWLES